jgi:hypothetical protein
MCALSAPSTPLISCSLKLAKPTSQSLFEVSIGGKIHRVTGQALQRWILKSSWQYLWIIYPCSAADLWKWRFARRLKARFP